VGWRSAEASGALPPDCGESAGHGWRVKVGRRRNQSRDPVQRRHGGQARVAILCLCAAGRGIGQADTRGDRAIGCIGRLRLPGCQRQMQAGHGLGRRGLRPDGDARLDGRTGFLRQLQAVEVTRDLQCRFGGAHQSGLSM